MVLQKKKTLEEELNLLAKSSEPSSLKVSEKPNIKSILVAIEKMVTDERDKFINNRNIYREINGDFERALTSSRAAEYVSQNPDDKNTNEES